MKTPHALNRAIEYLYAAVRSVSPAGGSLPSYRRMAAEAGVSLVTMSKAVGILRRQGLLTTSHRHGTRPAAAVTGPPTGPGGKKWERVARRMTSDIAAGGHEPGQALAPCGELGRRYGVSAPTVRKALALLCRGGILSTRGRRFVVFERKRPDTSRALLVLTRELSPHRALDMPHRRHELLRALEAECSRAGLRMHIVSYRFVDGAFIEPHADAWHAGASPIGAVLLSAGLEAMDLVALVDRLHAGGVPVSVLDETGTVWPRFRRTRRRVQAFSLANSHICGEAMGRCLLRYGHHSVAYISPFGHTNWSRARLVGIRRAFEEAGFGHRVKAFEQWQPETVDEPLAEAYEIHRVVERLIERGLDRRKPLEQRIATALPRTKPALRALLARDRFAEALLPLMTDALSCKGLTAWIAATDGVALECRRFLDQHRVRVPGDLSIASFDDSPDAYVERLTSYNFSIPALARAMLDFAVAPTTFSRLHGGGVVEIPGYVSERESVSAQ